MLKESQMIAIKEQAFNIVMDHYNSLTGEEERMIDRAIHYTPPTLQISPSAKLDYVIDWFNILDTNKREEYSKDTLTDYDEERIDLVMRYNIKNIEKAFLWVGEHFFAMTLHVHDGWFDCTLAILGAIQEKEWNISLKIKLALQFAFRDFADDINATYSLLIELHIDAMETKNKVKNVDVLGNDCHLYFLYFPSADSIKIGISKNLKIRAEKLSSEWGNIDFTQSFFITTDRDNAKKFEKAFHNLFHQNRSDIGSGDGYTELFSMSIAKQLDEILATSTMNGFKKQKIEPEYIS